MAGKVSLNLDQKDANNIDSDDKISFDKDEKKFIHDNYNNLANLEGITAKASTNENLQKLKTSVEGVVIENVKTFDGTSFEKFIEETLPTILGTTTDTIHTKNLDKNNFSFEFSNQNIEVQLIVNFIKNLFIRKIKEGYSENKLNEEAQNDHEKNFDELDEHQKNKIYKEIDPKKYELIEELKNQEIDITIKEKKVTNTETTSTGTEGKDLKTLLGLWISNIGNKSERKKFTGAILGNLLGRVMENPKFDIDGIVENFTSNIGKNIGKNKIA